VENPAEQVMNRTADAFSAVLNARWSLIYEVNVVFEIK
jgi:hypothetical protein